MVDDREADFFGVCAIKRQQVNGARLSQSMFEKWVERATCPSSAATCRRKRRQAGSLPQQAGGLFVPDGIFQTRSQPQHGQKIAAAAAETAVLRLNRCLLAGRSCAPK
jgi:hypothetical protein